MSKILVTGAAGFLGFHLSRRLADRGDEIVAVDSFIRGERDAHFAALAERSNVDFLELDLSDPSAVAQLPLDVDYVYHLAALNGTQNFYERPLEVIRACTLPTLLLAEFYGGAPGLKRFVYAGTSESYASTVTKFDWPVPTAEDVPLSIGDVRNPRWSYAASKTHGEVVTAQAGRVFNMPYSIIRYHNAYGPRMGDRHVIPDFYARVRENRYELYGHKDTRSFLYVDDAIDATILVGETDKCADEIINVGSRHEIDILSLGRQMLRVIDRDNHISLFDSPSGSVARRVPDVSLLNSLTTFDEKVSMSEGLAATARFYLSDHLENYGLTSTKGERG